MSTSYNYEYIKWLAADTERKVTDLLAMAPAHDPFYVGTTTDWIMARWFRGLWDRAGYTSGVHLRRAHYWAVSSLYKKPDGLTYQNTHQDWQWLTQAAKYARYLGLVEISAIRDNKSPAPIINAMYADINHVDHEINVPDISEPQILLYGAGVADSQAYHLVVVCEKSTMNDVLEPLCRQYYAELLTFEGEASITSVYNLVQRIGEVGRDTRVFYVSDFDPAGNNMPAAFARKLEWMLQNAELGDVDVMLKQIALTQEQVARYRIPRVPIKVTETRAGKFEENFGVGAAELDALEALQPGVLRRLVASELNPYFDREAAQAAVAVAQKRRADVSTRYREIAGKYADALKQLEVMRAELAAIDLPADEYAVERADADADEDSDEWLFASSRGYEDQIEFYKAHKRGD